MTEDQYISLCEKYLKGTCTQNEEALLKDYQDELGLTNQEWNDATMGNQDRIRLLLYNNLQKSLHQNKIHFIQKRKWQLVAAAAVLLFISVTLYLVKPNNPKQNAYAINHKKGLKNDAMPGTNRAFLTLANGKHIVLDSAANGILNKQGNTEISKSADGLIVKNQGNNNPLAPGLLNTITVPLGGKYDIVLPDGTKVWLNSSSALTFPAVFTDTERKVTLVGEAYFEVAKNENKPFKINVADKQTVEVLGTHFNISAYADDHKITTTLLEGSVKINYKSKYTYIKPGQMAVNDLENTVIVQSADIDEVMAWKNGMFIFNNENITAIMKKISRWYNVDVVFKGDMSHVNFVGNYSRSKSLSNLLKNIELTDKVHFVIEGRRVTVTDK